jgi:hypothetical protein
MVRKMDAILPEISPSGSPQPFLPLLAPSPLDGILPEISPSGSPQPFLPLLAPSPLVPFTNATVPKLSGRFIYSFCKIFIYIPFLKPFGLRISLTFSAW